MALAWKAGWVHALTSSNLVSSATLTRANVETVRPTLARTTAAVSVPVSVVILGRLLLGPQEPVDLRRHYVPDRVGDDRPVHLMSRGRPGTIRNHLPIHPLQMLGLQPVKGLAALGRRRVSSLRCGPRRSCLCNPT